MLETFLLNLIQGENCEIKYDECEIINCHNGTCFTKPELEGGFECNCKTGYEGKYCEIDSDDCASNPCQGEGSFCYDLGMFEVTLYPFKYFLFQLTTMSANVRVD